MLIIAPAFAVIFLFRDAQVLAIQDWRLLRTRFGVYVALIFIWMTALVGSTNGLSGWTNRRFALGAIAVQLMELMISLVLRRYTLDRYRWIGYILPSPALLVALYSLSVATQKRFPPVNTVTALEIVTFAWLVIVVALTSVLCWMKNPWEDRKFADDLAMMTSCTALIFVPFGLS